MLKTKKKIALALIAASLLAMPSGAWSADGDEDKTLVMESMTVSANKMEEDILEVPQSITVIDEIDLDEKGITDIPEVIKEIPNMEISSGIHGNAVSFRGLNSSMFTNSNPVVLYIDGIPYIDRYAFDASLANVDRVEVLRGPQGTLYGKDAMGGVISIITKNPGNEWQGKVGVEYGSFNYMQGLVNLSGALVEDTLFLGINGEHNQDDGWIENTYPGMSSDANISETQRIGAYLLYTPAQQLSARLTVSHETNEEGWTNGYALLGGVSFNDFNRDDAEEVQFDMPCLVERTTFSQSLQLSYDFGGMTLDSTTTHSFFDIDGDYDGDYGDNAAYAGAIQFNYSELDTYTQELRLSSNNGEGIRWVGGIYLESEDRDQGPYGQQLSYYGYLYEYNAESVMDTATTAVFGQVMVPLADRFELTLGARYQKIEKDFDYDMYIGIVGMNTVPAFSMAGEKEWDAFLPKVALNYQISDSWSAYVSYSRGYMPGGFNYFTYSGTFEDNSFEPEQSENYEIGIKGRTERLEASAALFYMDIDDIHVYYSPSPSVYLCANAEKAHSLGMELDLSYRLTDTIDLSGSLGLIEAEYDTYDAGEGVSFDGEKVQNTPAYTATAAISYTHPGGFYSRMDIRAVGDVHFYDDGNATYVKEDAYNLFDARIGYMIGAWDLYVYGENLADEAYVAAFISSTTMSLADFGDPRTIGAGIRYRF